MEGTAPTDEAMHGLRTGHQKVFLAGVRCFEYRTLHSWASFPLAWLLSHPAIAEGQHKEVSESARIPPLIPALVALLSPYVLLSFYGVLGTLQSVPKSAVVRYTHMA